MLNVGEHVHVMHDVFLYGDDAQLHVVCAYA